MQQQVCLIDYCNQPNSVLQKLPMMRSLELKIAKNANECYKDVKTKARPALQVLLSLRNI